MRVPIIAAAAAVAAAAFADPVTADSYPTTVAVGSRTVAYASSSTDCTSASFTEWESDTLLVRTAEPTGMIMIIR